REAAGASPPSRRPPARAPKGRSRGSAPTEPPRSSRTQTRPHARARAEYPSQAASACLREPTPRSQQLLDLHVRVRLITGSERVDDAMLDQDPGSEVTARTFLPARLARHGSPNPPPDQ